jgi:hypothetical protein
MPFSGKDLPDTNIFGLKGNLFPLYQNGNFEHSRILR